jgi:hypothetical protein
LLPDRRQKEIARIAQTAVEFPPMQKGQALISRVKATRREGDAVHTEISFNCVAYHQPRSVQASEFELVSTTIPPRTLGLPVPPSLLAPADEVIE